jgi:hypothetical protein
MRSFVIYTLYHNFVSMSGGELDGACSTRRRDETALQKFCLKALKKEAIGKGPGGMIVKWTLGKQAWTGSSGSGLADPCEHCIEAPEFR